MTSPGPVELEFAIKNSLMKPVHSNGEKLGCVSKHNAGHLVKKKELIFHYRRSNVHKFVIE